jgi:hypothetical protein
VAAIIRVERDVYTRNAKTGLLRHSAETAFYVSNTPVTAARAAEAIRSHWAIENDQACYLSRFRGGEQTGCADCKAAMVAASARTSLIGRDATDVERL